jgi:hypothetical protein
MSVLKRLGNVARGKVLEIGRSLSGDGGEPVPGDGGDPDELDPARPVRAPTVRPSVGSDPPADVDAKRTLLARLRAEGLLSDLEYAEKLAALDAPPAPPPARARRL